jgi:hypothetical protein
LVPFLGAGMSVDLCPDWQTLIEALEQGRTGTDSGGRPPSTDPAALIRRANEAIRLLAMDSSSARTTRVREALYAKPEFNQDSSHWTHLTIKGELTNHNGFCHLRNLRMR